MFSKLFGNNKLKPADLEKLLAQARRHLWRNELAKAKDLFDQVKDEIKAHVQKDSDAAKTLTKPNFEAQLGLWAVRYLQDQSHRSGIQKVLDRSNLDSDTAYFIAKVFQSREDVSPQALSAYRALLSFNTSAKLAKQIADILRNTDYSDNALQLLSAVVNILRDDVELGSRLCRWYLIAGRDEDARKIAYEVIGQQPNNIDANRCLAVLAERRQDWLKASEHYKVSGDNLRAAVALAQAREFAEARNLIVMVPLDQRSSPTWLYYHGWITFNQGDFSTALNSWKRLQKQYPDCNDLLADAIKAAQDQMLYKQLVSFQFDAELTPEAIDGSVYQALITLQMGAASLLRGGDVTEASSILKQAVHLRSSDIYAATYLMLAQVADKDSETADKQIYQQLIKHFQDASLFMWLRGLHLLKNGRNTGLKYLQKAYKDGVHKRHIPTEAVAVANWISSHMNGGKPVDISQGELAEAEFVITNANGLTTPFQRAAALSYMLQQMQNSREVTWVGLEAISPIEPSLWSQVQTAFYLHQGDWHGAVTSANGADESLTRRIISAALQDAVQQRDWSSAAEYVSLGLEIDPNNVIWQQIEQQLRPQIHQMLWQRKLLETLDFNLEKQVRSGTADTSVYHGMAAVYTQLAITKDRKVAESENGDAASVFTMAGHRTQSQYTGILEDQAHNDYWQLAIGYWAVALTDESYWETWAERRGKVLDETIKTEQIRELTQQTIPQMLYTYHQDEIHHGSAFAAHHRFYASIINREIELTQAVRYLMRTAERQRFKLPSGFSMFISPLLIKEYGYESQGREIVVRLSELRLSPYEAGLIRTAFSPISDVKALVTIHAYDMALETLRKLLENKKYTAIHNEVRQELCHVLELSAEEAVELERWDSALALTAEGRKLQPMNKEFVRLTSTAVIGWANSHIRKEEFAEAIQKLESVRSTLRQRNTELDTLLSDAYVEWAYEAGRDDDTEKARVRFEKAVGINPANERAKYGLNVAYYMRAASKADEQKDYIGALQDAERALEYHEDVETLILVAKLHRAVAYDFHSQKLHEAAAPHWKSAWECAYKQLELANTVNSLNFLVDIGVTRALSSTTFGAFEEAINTVELILQLPFDRSLINVDLFELLSALYTDYAVDVYNKGNHWRGKQLMQKALEYDPTNEVARKNLYTM